MDRGAVMPSFPLFNDPCGGRKLIGAALEGRTFAFSTYWGFVQTEKTFWPGWTPCRGPDGLPTGEAHSFRDTVRSLRPDRLLVLTQNVVWGRSGV